jgi:hypothetical protein
MVLDTKAASDLMRKGFLIGAQAIQNTDETWRLKLVPRKGDSVVLNSARSTRKRIFKSLDATASAARTIGFSSVEVQFEELREEAAEAAM